MCTPTHVSSPKKAAVPVGRAIISMSIGNVYVGEGVDVGDDVGLELEIDDPKPSNK